MNIEESNRRIIHSCRQLDAVLSSVRDEWIPDEPPVTTLYAAFGRKIAAIAGDLNEASKKDLFSTIEECFVEGDEDVKSAIATGLLEILLNESSANRFDFRVASPFLGEYSRKHCRDWDSFTGCKTPGL